jgi:hypothetical protein
MEFDREVALISERQKDLEQLDIEEKEGKEECAFSKEKIERNFNTLPRNYNDQSHSSPPPPQSTQTSHSSKTMTKQEKNLHKNLGNRQILKEKEQQRETQNTNQHHNINFNFNINSPAFESIDSHLFSNEEDSALHLFRTSFNKITIKGVSITKKPSPAYVITLLNFNCFLKKIHNYDSEEDIAFLTALALISGRRYTQASEILRKIENKVMSNLQNNPISAKALTHYPTNSAMVKDL